MEVPAEGDFPLGGWDTAPTSLQTLRAACPLHRLPSGEKGPCPLPGGGVVSNISFFDLLQTAPFLHRIATPWGESQRSQPRRPQGGPTSRPQGPAAPRPRPLGAPWGLEPDPPIDTLSRGHSQPDADRSSQSWGPTSKDISSESLLYPHCIIYLLAIYIAMFVFKTPPPTPDPFSH